jgi:hypothetical protein
MPKKMSSNGRKLKPAQVKAVGRHFEKIAVEIANLQKYLDGIGVHPVGGWRDPYEYSVVQGIRASEADCNDCTECSVVCFDGSCDCQECSNPKSLLADPRSTIKVGSGMFFQSVKPHGGFHVIVRRRL